MAENEHLLIDGYNLIYAWPDLRKTLAIDSIAVRTALADKVRVLHDFDGLRTTIVFDGCGDRIEIERPSQEVTFSFLFTPSGMTADAVIEQLVGKSQAPQSITVATEDAMIRETIISLGAFWLPFRELQDRITYCEQCQSDYLRRRVDS